MVECFVEGQQIRVDVAVGDGHFLLVEAPYIISQGFAPLLNDTVEVV